MEVSHLSMQAPFPSHNRVVGRRVVLLGAAYGPSGRVTRRGLTARRVVLLGAALRPVGSCYSARPYGPSGLTRRGLTARRVVLLGAALRPACGCLAPPRV